MRLGCAYLCHAAGLGLGLLLLGGMCMPRPAYACGECACYDDEPWERWLANERELPANLRILLPTVLAEAAVLRDLGGEPVKLELEQAGVQDASWVRSAAQLQVGQRYTLTVESGADAGAGEPRSLLAFTAGTADTTPLAVQRTEITTINSSDACNLVAGASLGVYSLENAEYPGALVYAQLDVSTRHDTNPTLWEEDRIVLPLRAYTQPQRAAFGIGTGSDPADCLLSRTVLHAAGGRIARARVTYFDLAGNATELESMLFSFGAVVQSGACPDSQPPPSPRDASAGAAAIAPPPAPGVIADAGAMTADQPEAQTSDVRARDSGCSVAARPTFELGWTLTALVWLHLRRRKG